MILPTPRALIVFACAAPIGLLGFLSPLALDLMLAVDVALFLAVWSDARLAVDPARLSIRRVAQDSFSVGQNVAFSYRWGNPSVRAARLLIRETRPRLLGGVMPSRRLVIGAKSMTREEQLAVPARRGRETAGWFAIRSRGPLGLGQRQRRVDHEWAVIIFPSLPVSRLKASIAEAARRREAGLRQLRRMGEGRQFESLREWVPGDDTRHIDWKASARRNKVIARQFEAERRQQVLLVLDAGRLLTAEVAGRARMEYVVQAALSLALAATRHDDNIGVMTLADEVMHYVTPQRGRRGLRQVLEVLSVVEPRLVESDYPAGFRYLAVRNRKRALTVFFTDVIDRTASEALVANVGSLRPRHLPLVVTLRNPELDQVAEARPATLAAAYRKAAAEELLSARDEALTRMRRSGAVVLDVPPERASAAVVEKYLELKRRGRL